MPCSCCWGASQTAEKFPLNNSQPAPKQPRNLPKSYQQASAGSHPLGLWFWGVSSAGRGHWRDTKGFPEKRGLSPSPALLQHPPNSLHCCPGPRLLSWEECCKQVFFFSPPVLYLSGSLKHAVKPFTGKEGKVLQPSKASSSSRESLPRHARFRVTRVVLGSTRNHGAAQVQVATGRPQILADPKSCSSHSSHPCFLLPWCAKEQLGSKASCYKIRIKPRAVRNSMSTMQTAAPARPQAGSEQPQPPPHSSIPSDKGFPPAAQNEAEAR